jgi:hypothetical protein
MPDVYKPVLSPGDINSETTYYIQIGRRPNWVYTQLGKITVTEQGAVDGDPDFLKIKDANGNVYYTQTINFSGTIIENEDGRSLGTLVTKSQEGGRRKTRRSSRSRRAKRRASRKN